jgi:hypothetical protein
LYIESFSIIFLWESRHLCNLLNVDARPVAWLENLSEKMRLLGTMI